MSQGAIRIAPSILSADFARLGEQVNPRCDLEVDGGIDEETAALVVAAGANVLVAGTSVFAKSQVEASMKLLQVAANKAANERQRKDRL